MSGVLETNTVTRQELVDYVVNKKIRAIQDQMGPLKKKRDEVDKKRSEVSQLHRDEKKEYSLKWIKANYGKMIETMKKNLDCGDPIIVPCYAYDEKKPRGSRDLEDMLHGLFLFKDSEAAIVFINKDSPKMGFSPRSSFGPGWGGSYHGGHFSPFDIASFIRIDMEDIDSPKSAKLKANKESLKAEVESLQNTINDMDATIRKIREDKDMVKDAIIEEILGKSVDGKALLEKVNNLPIGQKLIG